MFDIYRVFPTYMYIHWFTFTELFSSNPILKKVKTMKFGQNFIVVREFIFIKISEVVKYSISIPNCLLKCKKIIFVFWKMCI